MKTITFDQVRIININNASVTVDIDSKTVLFTRKIFNRLIRERVLEGIFVERPTLNNSTITWFGVINIF